MNKEELKINGTIEDISAMLVSAVRYALGRKTYIVGWTCEFITNNLHLLTKANMKVIIRDIEEQAEFGYGDKCDKEDWLKLLNTLKNAWCNKDG